MKTLEKWLIMECRLALLRKQLFLLSVVFCFIIRCAPPKSTSPGPPDVPFPERLNPAITAAGEYLAGQIKENGSFVYLRNIHPSATEVREYNWLRHAGSIYALCMYAHYVQKENDLAPKINRAVEYLYKKAVEPIPGQPECLAVWSTPQLTKNVTVPTAKLGGIGISLLAFLSAERITGPVVPLTDLQKLGNGILYLQKEDGSFYSRLTGQNGDLDDSMPSLYYPGEAVLGLLHLYEKDPQEKWLTGAVKALNYLAVSRENERFVPADHWALLASAKLMPHYPKIERTIPKEVVIGHAQRVCRSILYDDAITGFSPSLIGRNYTSPTATRLEGLLAVRPYLNNEGLIDSIDNATHRGLHFLLSAQKEDGAIPGTVTDSVSANNNPRLLDVRIDHVQHPLSAFIQFAEQYSEN